MSQAVVFVNADGRVYRGFVHTQDIEYHADGSYTMTVRSEPDPDLEAGPFETPEQTKARMAIAETMATLRRWGLG